MKKIHVGFLLSYDYDKLKFSIPPVYKAVDKIFIAQDINNLTWTGNKFEVEESFYEWLQEVDVDNKIVIYKDNFYLPELSAIQNDTRERHLLSLKMGIGNWFIQLDSDEYFINFEGFVETLKKYNHYLNNPAKYQIQFSVFLVNIYKKLDDGFLYVDEPTKCILVTNYPNYITARNTKRRVIYTKYLCFHETLSREEEELVFKFNNWGHSAEVNPVFLDKWRSANKNNYKELKDLFYLEPHKWKKLNYVKGKTIDEMIANFPANDFTPNKFFLFKKNFGQWFKFLFK